MAFPLIFGGDSTQHKRGSSTYLIRWMSHFICPKIWPQNLWWIFWRTRIWWKIHQFEFFGGFSTFFWRTFFPQWQAASIWLLYRTQMPKLKPRLGYTHDHEGNVVPPSSVQSIAMHSGVKYVMFKSISLGSVPWSPYRNVISAASLISIFLMPVAQTRLTLDFIMQQRRRYSDIYLMKSPRNICFLVKG